jgi:hypothetical protein
MGSAIYGGGGVISKQWLVSRGGKGESAKYAEGEGSRGGAGSMDGTWRPGYGERRR